MRCRWQILPHALFWVEAGELVVDGFRLAAGKVTELQSGQPYVSEFVRLREEAAAARQAEAEAARAFAAANPQTSASSGMATGVYESDEDEYELWTTDEEEEDDGDVDFSTIKEDGEQSAAFD